VSQPDAVLAKKYVSVTWVAKRWRVSRETVLRCLQSGELDGYRISNMGWWRVFEDSVLKYESKMSVPASLRPCQKGRV
jgi:hypothetical protein